MADIGLVHSYVARLLREWFALPRVVRDAAGNYPFRFGTALACVRVLERDPAVVRVFAAAVQGVDPDPDLLGELNDINAGTAFARVYLAGSQVCVESELWAETLSAFTLGMACERVGELADRIGPLLATRFTGATRFTLADPEGEEPQPA